MHRFLAVVVTLALLLATVTVQADIFRWDNGKLISGTEGIWPGPGVQLNSRDLSYADLDRVDLTGASFEKSDLTNAKLTNANLTGANLSGADLSYARLQYSTFANANLMGADLRHAGLYQSTFTNANLNLADLREADGFGLSAATVPNCIFPSGVIYGLDLNAGDQLVVRFGIPINVGDLLMMGDGSSLRFLLDEPWSVFTAWTPGIPITLGGTLELDLAPGTSETAFLGRTFLLFQWGNLPASNRFDAVAGQLGLIWDTSHLYTTGEVTLLAAGGVIAGDANGDGKVDIADFGTLKEHFGFVGTQTEGDANGDGKIDLADFGLLKVNFGKSATLVPEPATAVLAALGLALLLVAKVRRPPFGCEPAHPLPPACSRYSGGLRSARPLAIRRAFERLACSMDNASFRTPRADHTFPATRSKPC